MIFVVCSVFLNQLFEKFFQEFHYVSKRLQENQARQNVGLIWVQSVCEGNGQTTLVGSELIFS